MTCFHPMEARRLDNGRVVFHSSVKGWKPGDKYIPTQDGLFMLGCGQCFGCRLETSRQWAMRCLHEASLNGTNNCFITLTYDAEHLPPDCGLRKKHFQNFMKYLRRDYGSNIRFYHCGEYGDRNNRPHYHALLFGFNFDDWTYLFDSPSGEPIFTSPKLEKLWGKGFVTIGTLTFESAAYCARYVMKKINGVNKDKINFDTGLKHYERINSFTGEIVPVLSEYSTMSRGGRTGHGIGYDWIFKYTRDCYPKDYTTIRGLRMKPPKYYDRYLESIDPDMYDDIKAGRNLAAYESDESSVLRLSARKKVKEAQFTKLNRSL